ncbi:peroxidase [uncultured Selenomonas sp.]|uniref:peroxidase n=1 Tax=uncultured Selenomonas sp. TaxID=159275 RepID=UPI0025D17531|nr:peroxidase [uncultured Selenomonas sp.]
MSILQKMKRRRALALLKRACTLTLALGMTSGAASAASHDALHDVYGYFSYMMNVRDEIRSHRAALAALAEARADVESARANLVEAQEATRDAAANLALAIQNLRAAEEHLAAVRKALASAEEASALRTEEAIAAQNAEADYAPEVEAQRTALESLYREADSLSRASDTTGGENPDREKVVARILAEVGYEQNRIVDAQRMVEEALAAERGTTPDAAGAKLAAVSAEVDAAQARLDAMEAQLDALTALREQAEDAERDARELVADYTQEAQASEADLAESRKNKEEAETYDAEAKAWALQAADEQKAAERRLLQSEHDLAYFGEGAGAETGVEYYTWRGERAGHQLYLPLSYFSRTHAGKTKLDYGISAGYVKSHTGFDSGVSGLTDTQLSVTIHNEKPRTSVHYGLSVNLPTGESKIYQRAAVPEGLARFTDFGAGWQFIPSVEVTHRISERDRLTGRFSYAMRGGYDYSKEVPNAHVSPGNIFAQEIEYLHAGDRKSYMVQFYHNATSSAVQDAVDTDSRTITGKMHYRDGDDWELRFFYNGMIAPKDELRFYSIYALTEAAKGIASQEVARQYYGLGLRHRVSDKLTWQIMAHYQNVSTTYDPLRTALNTGSGFKRRSLIAGLAWKASERRNLTFQVERYVRSDVGGAGYNGWGTALWYQQSF